MFPGRRGRIGYPQAATLLRTLVNEISTVYTPQVYLSTRSSQAWLISCYAHNLRHARMRLSRDDFIAVHAGPSLQDIADEIASALGRISVTTASLDDTSSLTEGPLTPILDLLGLPARLRTHLKTTKIANQSLPPDIQAAFLLINRKEVNGDKRSAAKKQLIASYRSGRK
jgi:hypothetical protein